MIGQIIDNRYHIEAVLGQGAMGTVYRALDSQQDKIVALKTLHLNFSVATENALSRFNREFRVLAQLEHTGIVGAYGHGDYQGIPYLVMEYLDGQTLKDRLAEGPLPPELLHHITIQICQALAHIHSRSIVHRDLKPGNIMLLPPYDAPQVKLMDFGLVRVSDLSAQLTQEGMTLGTVAYMAPEQAQGFPVDSYADLYALGAILYEMATGRPPFVNENPVTVLMHQITASPLSPRHFNANLEEGLDRLILDLLAKEPSLRPANADTVLQRLSHLEDEAPPAPTSAQSVSRRIPRIPLIGRQDAMAHLMEHWLQAQTGAGRVLLLSGEAGAGKTRFLQEAGSHVRNSNGKFTRGVCRETASLPYQPFVDLLDGMLKQLTPAEQKLVPPEIARLLPSLANQVDEAPSGDPAEARLHTFSAFWQMLQRKSADQPVLFAIEDIQWADPSTLDLLDYLASRIDQANILFVFTYRPEEAASSPQLMTLLQNMERTPSTQQLTLNLLSREQVGEYLNIALRQENISDWLIDNFYQATEGNPLFLEETLKALVAEDEVSRWIEMDQSTSQRSMLRNMPLQLPKSVLSLAERRLQVLSDQDRSILTAAAVIGAEFPFAMLQELVQSDEDTLIDAIDRLLASQLIQELPLRDGDDRFRFTQESLRQALTNNASNRRLRQYHRRAGQALQTLYDTGQPKYWPALAYHFAEAGQIQEAIKYSVLAGDAAAHAYANPEAISHYSYALSVINNVSDQKTVTNPQQLHHLYSQLGRALELDSQFAEALQTYIEFEAVADAWPDKNLKMVALIARATIRATYSPVNDGDDGLAAALEALHLAQELGDCPAEAKVLWNLMLLHTSAGRAREAIAVGEKSMKIARSLDLKEQLAFVLNDITGNYITANQTEKVWPKLTEARELWRELDNKPMLADNLSRSAMMYFFRGHFVEAREFAKEGEAISESIGNLWNLTFSRWISAYLALEDGHVEQAITGLKETIDLSEQIGFTAVQVSARAHLGWLYAHLGAFEQALPLAKQAHKRSQEAFPGWQQETAAILARIHLFQNDIQAAEAILQESGKEVRLGDLNAFSSFFYPIAISELALAQKNFDQALTLLDEFIDALKQRQTETFIPEALCVKGKALLSLQQFDAANEALNEAQEIAERIGSKRSLGPILFNRIHLEQAQGNHALANDLKEQAQALAHQILDPITSSELKDNFLALPYMKHVLIDEVPV